MRDRLFLDDWELQADYWDKLARDSHLPDVALQCSAYANFLREIAQKSKTLEAAVNKRTGSSASSIVDEFKFPAKPNR